MCKYPPTTPKKRNLQLDTNITDIKLPNRETIKVVDDFKYIGPRNISSFNNFKLRQAVVIAKFWKLKKIWTSLTLKLKLKHQLFDSLVLSMSVYDT